MSQISLKSISGITSITTPTGVDNQFTLHTNDTTQAFKLDHAGNLHFNNHVNTTGISTASNFKTGTSDLHSAGLNVAYVDVDDFLDVGSNIKLGNAGIITATTFKGDGDFVELDVDGHTNLDNVSIAGVTTMTGALTISSTTDQMLNLNSSDNNGTSLAFQRNSSRQGYIGYGGASSGLIIANEVNDGDVAIQGKDGGSVINMLSFASNNKGLATIHGGATIPLDLDVDGHTNLDNISIAGVSTFTGDATFSANSNVNGALRVNTNRTISTQFHVVGGTGSGTAYDAAVFAGGQNSTQGSGVRIYLTGCENDPISRGTVIEGVMTDNQNAHALIFKTSPPAAVPVERLRIDAGGRLMIANTAAAQQYGGANDLVVGTTSGEHGITIISQSNSIGRLLFSDSLSSGAATYQGQLNYNHSADEFVLSTYTLGQIVMKTSNAERLRITSGGRLGLGSSSPESKLHIETSGTSAADGITFKSGSGSTGAKFFFATTNSDRSKYIQHSGYWLELGCHQNEGVRFRDAVNDVVRFYMNGNNGSYYFAGSNLSDRNLKENIETISTPTIDLIKQVIPKTFNWKIDNNNTPHGGFIAQEMQPLFPKLVSGTDYDESRADSTEGCNPTGMAFDYNGYTAYLTKAMQELITKVETLEAKVATLEGS